MNKAKSFFNKLNPRLNELKIFQNAYYWFILPLAIVFIACICGTVYEFTDRDFINIGIDFRGGTLLTVNVDGANADDYNGNVDIITQILTENGLELGATPQQAGNDAILVRYANEINGVEATNDEMTVITEKVEKEISAKFDEKYGSDDTTFNASTIGSSARTELIQKAFLSVGIAMLLMLVYIVIRFNLYSAIAAICGQLHDIIIMFALVIIFRVQVNSSMIACFITIVAYAINNTIVVFDRIRENVEPYKAKQQAKIDVRSVVNVSVGDVIKRTLLSSLTTLITITVLACFGFQTLTEFALPIIFGILAGVYSSTFISPSIWGLMIQAKQDSAGKAKKKKVRRARA